MSLSGLCLLSIDVNTWLAPGCSWDNRAVPYKGKFAMKISIEAIDREGVFIPLIRYKNVAEACHATLSALGSLRIMISAVKVVWEDFDGKAYGPRFTFHFVEVA